MLNRTALFLLSALTFGCVEGATDDELATEELATDDRIAEITENLLAAGYTEDDIELIDGEDAIEVGGVEARSAGPRVFVGGDVYVSLEASRELAGEVEGEDSFRQWRTPGLVTNNKTICLVRVLSMEPGEIGPSQYGPLSTNMSTGVSYARGNYNAINNANFGLDFQLRTGVGHINGGITVSAQEQVGCDFLIGIIQYYPGGLGGSSGFPSGGAPNSYITMTGPWNESNQSYEHIATHEIGHSIGLRHSDWMTRSSCGENTNEGQLGASQIAGTAYQTTNSVMAACFSTPTYGEFKGEDKEALEVIY